MQNVTSIRLFLLILFSALAASHAQAQMTPDKVDDVVSQLVDVLRSRVTPLDREAITFHYLRMEEKPKVQSRSEILDWAGAIADDFYNGDVNSDGMQGVGLYTATDPHSSRGYGSPYPVLFSLPLKKGTIVLDLIGERDDDEQSLAIIRSFAVQCNPSKGLGGVAGIEDVTIAFRNSNDLACRSVIIKTYQKLGVQAILYSYSSDQFVDGCRFRSDSFNVIDRTALSDDKNVGLFWNGGRFADLTLTRMISQTYSDVLHEFYFRYSELSQPATPDVLDSLQGLGTFERAARSWRKQNLLRCGPKWSIEGREPGEVSLVLSIRSFFNDVETQNAILDWHRAYRAKIDATTENIALFQRIKVIERKVYLETGLPPDFSKFDDWLLVSDAYNAGGIDDPNADKLASKLFGEWAPTYTGEELKKRTRSLMHELYDASRPQPGLFGAVLRRLGFGPLIIRLKLGLWNSLYGGMPLLASAPPMDASSDESELMALNKNELLSVLRQCTTLMNDPLVSASVVQAGDCGVRPRN